MAVLGVRQVRRQALVGAAVTALLIGMASAVPASAAKPAGGASIDGYVQGYVYGDCRLEGADQRPYRSVPGATRNTLTTSSTRNFTNGAGAVVGNLQQRLDVVIAPTMRAGGLAVLDLRASGAIAFWPSGTNATCGAASGSMVNGNSIAYLQTTQPIAGAGWLDLQTVNSSPNAANVQLTVWNAAGTVTTFVPQREVPSRASSHIYLPAGGMVRLWASVGTSVTRSRPITPYSEQRWSTAMRGVVTPIGAATGVQRGKLAARRSVVLPAAVSCAGSARIKVSKYGKKKSRSISILVNGKTKKKITRLRVKGYTVKVPRKGTITIKAKVTTAKGKKRATVRTYAACS